MPSLLLTNPRKFWSIVGDKKADSIHLVHVDGSDVDENECCTVLNEVFTSFFCDDNFADLPNIPDSLFCAMDPILFDWVGINRLIDNQKISASAGPDLINSKMLKCTALFSSIILSKLYTQSVQCSSLPSDWKTARVVPVHKSGNALCPENYRPISLTSIPCKLLEHVIYSHLIDFLESNSFFHPSQHGFRKTFSCDTQLLCFTNDLFAALDQGFDIDCIF